MRTLPFLLVLAACGPASVSVDGGQLPEDSGTSNTSCTVSACDAVGTWDVSVDTDAGSVCSYVNVPATVTFHRDGGELCASGVTSLSSDGGCGLTVQIDDLDPSVVDPINRYQTWDLSVAAGSFSGSNKMRSCCLASCQRTLPITGSRR